MSFVRSERVQLHNVWHGPWEGASHLSTLREAANEYFGSFDETNDLFLAHYERITLDLHDNCLPLGFGTREHQRELWLQLPTLPCYHFAGSTQKMGRWFSVSKMIRCTSPFTSAILLVMTYIGVTCGWWSSWEALHKQSLPSGDSGPVDVVVAEPADLSACTALLPVAAAVGRNAMGKQTPAAWSLEFE